MAFLDEVVSRRLDEAERLRHDAFLAEITSRWQPTTRREHWLHRRARFVHMTIRLFGGGPTLMQVAVASTLLAVATSLRMVAAPAAALAYRDSTPGWARALVVVGLLTLAVQAFRSPRRIQQSRTVALFLTFIPIVKFWQFVAHPRAPWALVPAQLAWIIAAAAVVLVIFAARLQSRRVLRLALVVAAAAASLLALAEALRVAIYLADRDELLAASSALSLFACTLIAGGLARARVELGT